MFDANCHPTLNGKWTDGRSGMTFEEMKQYLSSLNFTGACAVGISGVGDYSHEEFFKESIKHNGFYKPVAPIESKNQQDLENEFNEIIGIGYEAVKIHFRDSHIQDLEQYFQEIFRLASLNSIKLYICTYTASDIFKNEIVTSNDLLKAILRASKLEPSVKIVLAHGGVTSIMEYSLWVRHNKNILLDLSFTLQKFNKSSLTLDLNYLAENMDERICFGSDLPDVKINDFEESLDFFRNINESKKENIYSRNIKRFLML
jgi:predicted TIM-barrel fold metal-dependent hydrolase